MSLARLGADSDVYVYQAERMYVCHWCTFRKSRERIIHSRRAMRRHFKRHVATGDKVPREAFTDVRGHGR